MTRVPEPLRWTAAAAQRLVDASAREGGAFLLEGRKAVLDALGRPRVVVREVWIAQDLDREVADPVARAAVDRGVRIGYALARDLARVSDTVSPQGVLAWADDVAWGLDDLVAGARGLLLVLDGVQDPGNVGAILRVAAAFGASGVLVGEGTADPLGPKALRASAGTAVVMPFARGTAAAIVDALGRASVPVWLLDGQGDSVWDLASRPKVVALAVGSEGRGASPTLRSAAAVRIAVPISPTVESLNAAVAAGIAVAHLARLPAGRGTPAAARAPGPAARRPRGGGA